MPTRAGVPPLACGDSHPAGGRPTKRAPDDDDRAVRVSGAAAEAPGPRLRGSTRPFRGGHPAHCAVRSTERARGPFNDANVFIALARARLVEAPAPFAEAGAPLERARAPLAEARPPIDRARAPHEEGVRPVEEGHVSFARARAPNEEAREPLARAGLPLREGRDPHAEAVLPADEARHDTDEARDDVDEARDDVDEARAPCEERPYPLARAPLPLATACDPRAGPARPRGRTNALAARHHARTDEARVPVAATRVGEWRAAAPLVERVQPAQRQSLHHARESPGTVLI